MPEFVQKMPSIQAVNFNGTGFVADEQDREWLDPLLRDNTVHVIAHAKRFMITRDQPQPTRLGGSTGDWLCFIDTPMFRTLAILSDAEMTYLYESI